MKIIPLLLVIALTAGCAKKKEPVPAIDPVTMTCLIGGYPQQFNAVYTETIAADGSVTTLVREPGHIPQVDLYFVRDRGMSLQTAELRKIVYADKDRPAIDLVPSGGYIVGEGRDLCNGTFAGSGSYDGRIIIRITDGVFTRVGL